MPKTIKVDFFKVVMPDNAGTTFETLLDRIAHIPLNDDARTRQLNDDPVRLQELHHHADRIEGDMVRTRMDTLPEKSNVETGELSPLDLEEDEGLGEGVAFSYDPASKCLTMQRNHFSISANGFATYCTEIAGFEGYITLEPLISGDAITRLHDFDRVTRLSIKVAGLVGGAALRNSPFSLSHIAEFADEYAGPIVNVDVSMGHQRGSLAKDRVMAVVNWLKRGGRNQEVDVRKIEVSGAARDEKTEILDLLESRIVERRPVEINEQRTVPYTSRRDALRAAWDAQRDRIRAILMRPAQ
jgi:hypothetical protein